ncbi:conserved hypothetical protein [Nostocoides japonicum T1-X7]|uniref:DUF4307 domain-containing protein n=1 Tax=Nostocoides japonicum T1-X7 TaxID=1194083 RepID=A0A077M142_9MICO|nr:conserved hypothetical protein [Tetrasphaera japonica T1-X7]
MAIVLAVVLVTWLTLLNTVGQVTSTVTGYHVVDDATVTLDFDVHRPEGAAVHCTVQALNSEYSVVGTLEVDIPAEGARSIHRHVTIRTASRAVTGTVDSCAKAGP